MGKVKKFVLVIAMLVFSTACFSACASSEPCSKCGKTPTKGYDNTVTGEKEYFCSECSSECMWCQKREATHHYTANSGHVVFMCDECYEDFMEN